MYMGVYTRVHGCVRACTWVCTCVYISEVAIVIFDDMGLYMHCIPLISSVFTVLVCALVNASVWYLYALSSVC